MEASRYFSIFAFNDRGLPMWHSGKESACNAGDTGDKGSIPGSERSSGVGNGNLLQYSCLEKFHGQRGLTGYSPRGRKELDTTEQLSTHTHLMKHVLVLFVLSIPNKKRNILPQSGNTGLRWSAECGDVGSGPRH